MTDIGETELLVLTFGEADDDAWERERTVAKQFFRERLDSYPQGPLSGEVSVQNIGRGADWMVIAVSVASAVTTAMVAIPKVHKFARETIEEWHRIHSELTRVYDWIRAERPALYPDTYLFLVALEHLDSSAATELSFHGVKRLPESNPDLQGREDLLFSFMRDGCIEQVAVSRSGGVLWKNSIPIQDAEGAQPYDGAAP